ncbi:MAG: DUF459 domain-containing protein [Candidatus Nanopelagicales bacterium]|nr:DUF459 domain-containing protein [Candidatus Nanopelagicales bacterium]
MTDTLHESPVDQPPAEQPKRNRADSYHPAMHGFEGRRMPAGHIWLVVVIALAIAVLFNSGGFLRDANGMRPGLLRTVMVGVATPIDAVAGWLHLDAGQQALAGLLGQNTDEADGAALLAEQSVPEPSTAPTLPALTNPTAADPLKILVVGDSLSTFVGQQMSALLADSKTATVSSVWRNGTGLTNPAFFNWEAGARSIMRDEQPDAVVVLIGGNERNDMTLGGRTLTPGTADWEAEYERRARVVMRAIMQEGAERVFWSGPPTARDPQWNDVYADVNAALSRAAADVPGVQYVDLYDEVQPFSMQDTIDGERVVARQRDGIHWTYPGSLPAARQQVAALETVYGDLRESRSTTTEVTSDAQPTAGTESAGP